ncbi:MAG: N-acetyltransferase, partial [Acidobacteriota bacterium]
IEAGEKRLRGIGLAPMAVWPERQNEGIGSRLVEAGLTECRKACHRFVIVLGHPEFYPRFGFVPASRFGIKSEYDVRDEVFMAMELQEGSLAGFAGIAKYLPEFNEV